MLPMKPEPRFAVIDGHEVHLYASVADINADKELPWPSDWPSRVTAEFLASRGVNVRTM
jgi:hypothetical protein